jgi:hypothetical protein
MKHFHEIREKGLKESIIKLAWRKCGLIPYNPDVVLSKIKELEVEPWPKTLEKTPPISSPLCRTLRTIPQFAKGIDFMLKLIKKGVEAISSNNNN